MQQRFRKATAVNSIRDKRSNILVVDDDIEIGILLKRYLAQYEFQVTIVTDSTSLQYSLRNEDIHLVLLDLGLPDEDGLDVIAGPLARWAGPVIIISGRSESVDRIVGLEMGADDYISKPFDLREVLARIRSVLRRSRPITAALPADEILFSRYRMLPGERCLLDPEEREIHLTSGEFELLLALLEQPNQVVSRDHLMNRLHGRNAGPYDRAVDVQIGRLRRKIEPDPSNPLLIKSVRGAGYQLTSTVNWVPARDVQNPI